MDLLWPSAIVPPSLGAGEVHVWVVRIDDISLPQQELRKRLSADEKARADQFRLERPAQQFSATRAALRTLLGHYLHVPPDKLQFSVAGNSKPQMARIHSAIDLRFSVSHSGALALLALTIGNEVGVDLECLRRVSHAEQIARRYFHKKEIAAIGALALAEQQAAFLRCWTAKEAVLKAIGIGITSSLDSFDVPPERNFNGRVDLSRLEASSGVSDCWMARLVPHRDYLAAIAVLGASPQLLCHTFVM